MEDKIKQDFLLRTKAPYTLSEIFGIARLAKREEMKETLQIIEKILEEPEWEASEGLFEAKRVLSNRLDEFTKDKPSDNTGKKNFTPEKAKKFWNGTHFDFEGNVTASAKLFAKALTTEFGFGCAGLDTAKVSSTKKVGK